MTNEQKLIGARETLHARLRQETGRLHEDLECLVDIEREISSHARYVAYLTRLWCLHTAAESALGTIDFTPAGFDYARRQRSSFLEADLHHLGFPLRDLHQLPRVTAPALQSIEDGLGCVYVVEGSALGARAILPKIKNNLGLTGYQGASFFEGFGEEGKPLWRACLAAINAIAPKSEQAGRVVDSAKATFLMYLQWLPLSASRTTSSATAQA